MKPVRPLDLIGLGECMVELLSDEPLGHAVFLKRSYGGDILNSLIAAQREGSRTGFITRVGNDPFGSGLRSGWQAEGLDLTCAPLVEGENGIYFISLLPGGEREFTYRRAGSAASELSPGDVSQEYVASARTLLLSGITQAISPGAQQATLHAAQLARDCGTQVAFDPNYRPRLWEPRGGFSAARKAFQEVLPYVDVLLPSYPADLPLLDDQYQDPLHAVKRLQGMVPQGIVALKCGEDGVYLGSDSQRIAAQTVENVLDTTGAGDAWNGVFLHALHSGQSAEQAAGQAHRAAAHTIRHRGAVPPPRAHPSP